MLKLRQHLPADTAWMPTDPKSIPGTDGGIGAVAMSMAGTGVAWEEGIKALRKLFPGSKLSEAPEIFDWTVSVIRAMAANPSPAGASGMGRMRDLFRLEPELANRALASMEGLVIQGNMALVGFKELADLPRGLRVMGNFTLNGCDNLRKLPEGLRVKGEAFVFSCRKLLGSDGAISVGRGLFIRLCPSIQSLGSPLSVGGKLEIECCPAFRRLPRGLSAKTVALTGLGAWTGLPRDLQVKGGVKIEDCPRWDGVTFPNLSVEVVTEKPGGASPALQS